MANKGAFKVNPKIRKRAPLLDKKSGQLQILCPHCPEPHPIMAAEKAHCGTYIELTAVQEVYQGRAVTCERCKEAGGTLQKIGPDAYIHTHNCNPNTTLVSNKAKPSLSAKLMWKMPDWVNMVWAKAFRRVVVELESGYVWKEIERWQTVKKPS